MSDLIPIQTVDDERIRKVIRDSLRGGLNYSSLADFVARVDWSHVDAQALPPIAATLGMLEHWTTEYAEGDLTRQALVAKLLSLLPAEERPDLHRAASTA